MVLPGLEMQWSKFSMCGGHSDLVPIIIFTDHGQVPAGLSLDHEESPQG
jgi:hypothetical protein